MKDNRQYQRGKNRQENSSPSSSLAETRTTTQMRRQHDVIGSFDYAIRPDGEILSEFLWKQRRLEGKPFMFIDKRPAVIGEQLSSSTISRQVYPQNSSDISLTKIESMIKNTSLQYEKLSSLPEEPTFIKPTFASSLSSSLPSSVPSSNVTAPASLQQQQQQNNQNQNQNSKENNYNMNSNNAKLPYNNMMNQQQPNNYHKQSAISSSSSGPANSNFHNKNNNNDPIVEDDDYDDIIANLDVEEALSQHKKTTSSSSHFESMKNNMTSSGFDYGSNSNSNSNYGSGRDYSNGGGGGGNNNNGNSTINNHRQQQHEPFRNSNYDNNSSSNNQSSSNFNTNNNSSSVERSSYFESSSSSGRDTYNTTNNNNQPNVDNNTRGNNNNNNNNCGDGTPHCPGHNKPCRVFTANTSTNMGRQFFKCSLPEGQNCDFFQWKDGDVEENNWNDNNNNSNNNYGSSASASGASGTSGGGNILDMYEENQRVFGHRTFRKGQQLVIEKAIQGKDVFVLMPTG
jgi:hypothetical protein